MTKITKSGDSRASADRVLRRRSGRADWAAVEKRRSALPALAGSGFLPRRAGRIIRTGPFVNIAATIAAIEKNQHARQRPL